MPNQWHQYPPIMLASPTLALATGHHGTWAGGYGGVAWYGDDGQWQTLVSGLPVMSVAALAYAGGWLLAGGAGGIARSHDRGQSWELTNIQGDTGAVTAIAASPAFESDTTLLAATLGNGVLRSTDAGTTWMPAPIGLQSVDVTALLWLSGEQVLAATDDGIYRSTTAGRTWRGCTGSDGAPIAGLTALPDGSVLAAVELGGILRSDDRGSTWSRWGDLAPETQATALLAADNVVLLGTVDHGLLRSLDCGVTWSVVAEGLVLALASGTAEVLAGIEDRVLRSVDQGATWSVLPQPPLHDLRRLFLHDGAPLLVGTHDAAVRYDASAGWTPLDAAPMPLVGFAIAPDGALLLSNPDGLSRSSDSGVSWQVQIPGAAGAIAHMTFRPDGTGWAMSGDGTHLLHTKDFGLNWQPLDAPFGVLPVVALQATSELLMAATYDPWRQVASLWRSNDGTVWTPGAEMATPWPVVATQAVPPGLTLGDTLFMERMAGNWLHVTLPGSGIRRIAAEASTILALTTAGIMRSNDTGLNWMRDDEDLAVAQIMDIAIENSTLYVLLAGGNVWSRPL